MPHPLAPYLLPARLANAVAVRTFFQPDQFYQALEPAWQLAHGAGAGAWLTWEWHWRLRGALQPLLFAALYRLLDACSPAADVAVAAPAAVQALFAALADWATYRLACACYPPTSALSVATGPSVPSVALVLSLASPGHFFLATRTFANSLETSLTVAAFSLWPWRGLAAAAPDLPPYSALCSFLLLALASVLRPTNVLISVPLVAATLYVLRDRAREQLLLLRQAAIAGSLILLVSLLADRLFYHAWTFPPYHFYHFNVAQSIALFYGRSRPDYYLTEAIPLLLTTALPFALVGLKNGIRPSRVRGPAAGPGQLPRAVIAASSILTVVVLSFVGHKEVRFLYPLLPLLLVLAAEPVSRFFFNSQDSTAAPSSRHNAAPGTDFNSDTGINSDTSTSSGTSIIFDTSASSGSPTPTFKATGKTTGKTIGKTGEKYTGKPPRNPLGKPPGKSTVRRPYLLVLFVALNVLIAAYTTQVHQRGVMDLVTVLRRLHEHRQLPNSPADRVHERETSFALAMPCHSTPWRSHLIYPRLQGWALRCEPPIDIPLHERDAYLDEADQFYADPIAWLDGNMQQPDPKSSAAPESARNRREWPMYWAAFEQLDDLLGPYLQERGYRPCWRAFNSHWHDDWRRRGDVLLWCRQNVVGPDRLGL